MRNQTTKDAVDKIKRQSLEWKSYFHTMYPWVYLCIVATALGGQGAQWQDGLQADLLLGQVLWQATMLLREFPKKVSKTHLRFEEEWRSLGVHSLEQVHYMTHEPHILLFRQLLQKTNKNEVPRDHLIFFKFNVYEHIRQYLVTTWKCTYLYIPVHELYSSQPRVPLKATASRLF